MRLQICTWAAVKHEEKAAQESVDHLPYQWEVPRLEPGKRLRILGALVHFHRRRDKEYQPCSARRGHLFTACAHCGRCPVMCMHSFACRAQECTRHLLPDTALACIGVAGSTDIASSHDVADCALVADTSGGVGDPHTRRSARFAEANLGCFRHRGTPRWLPRGGIWQATPPG